MAVSKNQPMFLYAGGFSAAIRYCSPVWSKVHIQSSPAFWQLRYVRNALCQIVKKIEVDDGGCVNWAVSPKPTA
jgi:hypothetical protein